MKAMWMSQPRAGPRTGGLVGGHSRGSPSSRKSFPAGSRCRCSRPVCPGVRTWALTSDQQRHAPPASVQKERSAPLPIDFSGFAKMGGDAVFWGAARLVLGQRGSFHGSSKTTKPTKSTYRPRRLRCGRSRRPRREESSDVTWLRRDHAVQRSPLSRDHHSTEATCSVASDAYPARIFVSGCHGLW